ncbi:MAG: hypothetical protein P8L85_22305 [Rubripirellula sp.]|nr:hypothetical protein [Rubripirellula sp.]
MNKTIGQNAFLVGVMAFALQLAGYQQAACQDTAANQQDTAANQQDAAANQQDAAAESKVDIPGLIQKLDSNRFADRKEGSQKLSTLGKAAIEPLKAAAKSDSREVGSRSIQILKQYLESEDEEVKSLARKALESLAEGDDAAAVRATDALKPKTESPKPQRMFPGNLQLGGGNIQIQVQAIGGNGRNMRVKNVNGVKEIEAKENGTKVKIIDDPVNGIKMEVTKNTNGKIETKKYEAKNAEELKKNEPEAHKLYEKYSDDQGIKIQMQGLQAGGKFLPLQMQPRQIPKGAVQPPRAFDPRRAAGEIRSAREDLEKLIERSKQVEGDEGAKEQLEEIVEQLEASQEKLKRAMESLGPFGR